MKKIILSIVVLAAISLTSCSNDEQIVDSQSAAAKEQQLTNKTAKSALALCDATSTSVTVNRWQAPSSTYTNWTPVSATIGSVSVQWEGIYGASLRPTTGNWYVGTVTLNQTCANYDSWSSSIVVFFSKTTSTLTSHFSNSSYFIGNLCMDLHLRLNIKILF